MAQILVTLINLIYYALVILIFARFILSWVRVGSYQLRETVFRLTEPLLAPIRNLMPATMGIDFSPIILLLIIQLARTFLVRAIL